MGPTVACGCGCLRNNLSTVFSLDGLYCNFRSGHVFGTCLFLNVNLGNTFSGSRTMTLGTDKCGLRHL